MCFLQSDRLAGHVGEGLRPSLVLANGDPRDRFFYPTLTLMVYSYTLLHHFKFSVVFVAWFALIYLCIHVYNNG